MPRQSKVNTETLKEMYCNQHLTCDQIGKLIGMSRVGVWKRLQSIGVSASEGERVKTTCDQCGDPINMTRKRWRSQRRHFCSEGCYYKALHNLDYHFHRHGMRLARKAVSAYFKLQPDYVVHHWDGDNDNNTITNLAVFSNQSEHMRFHRGGESRPIWDGRELSTKQ